jgi:serine O-acetyltransferase
MGNIFKKVLHTINATFYWQMYVFVKNNERFKADLQRWVDWKQCPYRSNYMRFVYLMTEYEEFRNVCYFRMGMVKYLFRILCPPVNNLYLYTKDIGGGFLVQHGFSTIINANKIGENCKIFQQVTVGYNGDKRPTIGDNVEICCGAKVIGGVTVGNNVVIGAQALVVKDVPDNAVVGGALSQIIKYK